MAKRSEGGVVGRAGRGGGTGGAGTPVPTLSWHPGPSRPLVSAVSEWAGDWDNCCMRELWRIRWEELELENKRTVLDSHQTPAPANSEFDR
jgi:hypothetical protein